MGKYKEYTPTELLKLSNDVKYKHDVLKQEIVDLTHKIDNLEKEINDKITELQQIENEYVEIIEEISDR